MEGGGRWQPTRRASVESAFTGVVQRIPSLECDTTMSAVLSACTAHHTAYQSPVVSLATRTLLAHRPGNTGLAPPAAARVTSWCCPSNARLAVAAKAGGSGAASRHSIGSG